MTYPHYGIHSEVADSYRRSLEFNNSLLLKEFDERYDYKTKEGVRKLLSNPQGTSPIKLHKFTDSREALREKRRAAYEAKLRASVEPAVRRYAHNILAFIKAEDYI